MRILFVHIPDGAATVQIPGNRDGAWKIESAARVPARRFGRPMGLAPDPT